MIKSELEMKRAALRDRVRELAIAIQDIERRRRTEPGREHPTQEYIDGLKFDLRAYHAELEAIDKSKEGDDDTSPPPQNVVPIGRAREA